MLWMGYMNGTCAPHETCSIAHTLCTHTAVHNVLQLMVDEILCCASRACMYVHVDTQIVAHKITMLYGKCTYFS